MMGEICHGCCLWNLYLAETAEPKSDHQELDRFQLNIAASRLGANAAALEVATLDPRLRTIVSVSSQRVYPRLSVARVGRSSSSWGPVASGPTPLLLLLVVASPGLPMWVRRSMLDPSSWDVFTGIRDDGGGGFSDRLTAQRIASMRYSCKYRFLRCLFGIDDLAQ